MIAYTNSATLSGVVALPVAVETNDGERGDPRIVLVGLPDSAVRESIDRVQSGITSSGFGDKRIECLKLLKSFQSKHSKKQISDGRNLASQVRQNFEKRRLKLFIQDWESKPTAYRMSDSEKASKKVRLKIKHLENKKEIATKNKKLFDKKRHEILAIHRDGRMSDEDAVRKLKNLKDEEARKVSYEEQQDLILLHHSAGLIDDNEATKRLKAIKNN
jgi:hypothetical protein